MNQLEIEEYIDKLLQQTETDVDEVFTRRLKVIQRQVNQMYIKYETNGELSWTDVNKYNRLQKEMKVIAQLFTEDYLMIIQKLQASLESQYVEGYLRTAYLLEKTAATEMGFTIPSVAFIREVLLNPVAEMTLNKILEPHRNEIVRRINIEISQGIIAGEGYAQMAKRLERAVDFSRKKAKAVVRTEGGRVRSLSGEKAEEKAKEFAKITGRWMSALDLKVRSSHRRLDGTDTNNEGYFTYGDNRTKAPLLWVGPDSAKLSINCRCVKLRIVNGMLPEYRRGRDYMDPTYQRKLADRIDKLMADESLTYKQALKKAQKEISPPSVVREYETFEQWNSRLKKAS
ncbi:phage minor head protein [Jeotgalibacillus campisalis]|uniref:Phage head morphogenesis domain-containing protein n=1 Tax=Jeotgalibacillus campisalis TaxID=220754 RepID=A0A0C2VNZ1_9BACL|nr:phage minor head protein [Jeotgalibacillus campisalis]KIL46166.1 hypothetical protein KR50_28410 [Jeotgalibacillus campisalis]